MNISKIWISLLLSLVSFSSFSQPKETENDNGIIKIKLDLTRGGAICYASLSGSDRNLVNIADEGRYIQQSYYAGRSLDRKKDGQSPNWSPWTWNPIQVGDAYRNRAEILKYEKNGDTLYVKCIPMLWDMNNSPAEATMEQWTVLKGNVIEVLNKLTCFRTDTIYGEGMERDQELPAVYPISELKNLYYYKGANPFTGDSISNPQVVNLSSGFWGRYPDVTEHWMAFVDDNYFGMGVYNPMCTYFLAGMYGKPGHDAYSSSTSYIAPVKKAALMKNSVYEYTCYIIIGKLDEIRNKIYCLNKQNPLVRQRKSLPD